MQKSDLSEIQRSTRNINFMGKILINLYVIKAWCNGDGISFVFRWWNPLAWVMLVVMLILSVFLDGVPKTWRRRDDLGLCLGSYWKKRKDERVFIKPGDWQCRN